MATPSRRCLSTQPPPRPPCPLLPPGSGSFNIVISKPWINAVYDTKQSDFKLVTWMERAGILTPAPDPEPQPAAAGTQQPQQQTQQPQTASAATATGTTAAPDPAPASSGSDPLQEQDEQQQQQQQQGTRPGEDRSNNGSGSGNSSSGSSTSPSQPTRLVDILARINSKMDITVDVRVGRVLWLVADGMLLVPEEIRCGLGGGRCCD